MDATRNDLGARAVVEHARTELRRRRAECQALDADDFVHLDARELSSLLIARMHELSQQIRKTPERVERVDLYTVTHQSLRELMQSMSPFDPISFGIADLLALVGSSAEAA